MSLFTEYLPCLPQNTVELVILMEPGMENLRNNDIGNELAEGAEPSYVAYDDDDMSAVEPPPAIGQDERRMHVRAYNFWAGLLGERQFPSVEDLNPENDDDFGPNSVLLDFTDGVENPAIQFLGDALREECEIGDDIQTIDEVPARSLLSRITDHYLQIIANQAPIGFEAEFVNQRGITIMYRGILLPFSTDDDNIDFIYGVINWKEVAADQIVETLENEVAEAMLSAPAKAQTGPLWADGPASGNLDALSPLATKTGGDADPVIAQPATDANLSDWLSIARDSAQEAANCEQRSRAALYAAVGQAYDFYLMTQAHPEDYEQLLEDAGMKAQERAPMTPIAKLVFGVHYDKTRLTEYASALRFANQAGIERGAFAGFLESHEGGLKAVVHQERESRKPANPISAPNSEDNQLFDRLRAAPARQLSEIDTGDDEFVVLVARRDASGSLSVLGSVQGEQKLKDQVLKRANI